LLLFVVSPRNVHLRAAKTRYGQIRHEHDKPACCAVMTFLNE